MDHNLLQRLFVAHLYITGTNNAYVTCLQLPTARQHEHLQVEPLALSAADGLNACIFAYGQTGSGKTHTMIGDAKGGDMAGVSYRTMNKLFQVLELRRVRQVRWWWW